MLLAKPNEAFGALKHALIGCGRVIFRRSPDRFLPRFAGLGLPVATATDEHGKRLCRKCGYSLIRISFDNGWTMELCSAMPVLLLNSPLFAKWQRTLAQQKLPSSCV